MAYLGNQPALSYTSFAKQDFTTSATTSYTLSQPVANENEIALFINFVRQEPTTAYTASGTSLTLTSAVGGADETPTPCVRAKSAFELNTVLYG